MDELNLDIEIDLPKVFAPFSRPFFAAARRLKESPNTAAMYIDATGKGQMLIKRDGVFRFEPIELPPVPPDEALTLDVTVDTVSSRR